MWDLPALPPPSFLVASMLALLSYSVAYPGQGSYSIVPYVVVAHAIIGHNLGVCSPSPLVGQNGFPTAALIGGTLEPIRPVLAGICLGLLTYNSACCFRLR